MSDTRVFAAGGYRTIPAVFQYSGGVAAEPGFAIERVTFRRWLPLAEGFGRVAAYLQAVGRPLAAFCACELRSPAPFSEAGFVAFNQHYCEALASWGVYDAAMRFNPVARSNVCPLIAPPPTQGASRLLTSKVLEVGVNRPTAGAGVAATGLAATTGFGLAFGGGSSSSSSSTSRGLIMIFSSTGGTAPLASV